MLLNSSLNFRKEEFLISNGILFHIFGPMYFNERWHRRFLKRGKKMWLL